nr:PAS domain S-box protein [Dehalococcoidia bacterium]
YERDLQTGIATFYSDIDSHLGYEPGEYPRTMEDWREHVHPEDLAWIDRRSIYQLEPDVPHSIEYRMRKKDGTYMTWWDRVMLIRDEKTGKPIKFIGAATDITERKQAEEALRESEEKLRLMFESVTEGITITDLNGNVVDTNEATARMHGCYSKEKLIGQSAFALIAERDQTRAIENLKRTLEEGYIGALEYTLLREDGSEFPGELNAALIRDMSGSPIGFVAITTDITERKQAEAALRESEEKLRRMFESVSDGIAVTDLDGVITDVNRRTVEMLGYATEDDLVGRNTFDLVAPVDGERAAANMQRTLQEGRAEGLEYTLVKADGSVFPGNMGTSVLRNASGEPAGFIAVTRDITERKQVEEEVRKSEERLKVTLDSIQAGVVIIDEETRAIVDVNPYAAGMFGASNEKIIGHVCHKFICPAEVGECPIIDLGQSADNSERVLVNINGESIPVLKTVSRIMLGGRNCLLESFVDLSDRKEMEEERRRIENLESIGTLAGGIAHDFNNIQTGIMGNISLARRYAKPESKVEERLLEAEKASLRAKDLTRQLLTFARGVAPIKKLVSIAELIEDSTTFALRGSNVRCEFSFQYDLRSVEIDEGQINQVITNLVLNAGEAMPGGGIVNIGVKNRVITTRSALPLPEGNYLEITIADHGVGISKENLRKLFDPYFTTKPKGSGLGLSTAYSIIKNHGGRITVNSRLEVGTTFHIYLPASEKPVPVKKEAAAETTVASKGRILVMDDEEAIRELLHNELTGIGYEVELTVDGTQAIEQYTQARESGQPFDAVILDLTVPGGVGGKEVIEKLLEIDPGVKAIVTSGYSTNPIMSAFREYGFSAAVAKPYSTGELEKILRSITGNGE